MDPSELSRSKGAAPGAMGEVAAIGEEGAAARSALTARERRVGQREGKRISGRLWESECSRKRERA